jgi:hypothetical protein
LLDWKISKIFPKKPPKKVDTRETKEDIKNTNGLTFNGQVSLGLHDLTLV